MGDHKIWVCIDETTDYEYRNVANLIFEIIQAKPLKICIFFKQNI